MHDKVVLYVSYDGILDPVGRSQILPYLFGLQTHFRILLVSFEKNISSDQTKEINKLIEGTTIHWYPLPYHRNFFVFSHLVNFFVGKKLLKKLIKYHKPRIIHARSYVAAWLVYAFLKKKDVAFVFDMRGFWVDERVDGNLWNLKHPLYRFLFWYFKKWEQRFIRRADHIVSLTFAAADWMVKHWRVPSDKITVIPCCTSFEVFNPSLITTSDKDLLRSTLGIQNDQIVLGYVGSTGTWYLLDEMLRFFEVFYQKNNNAVFLLVVNQLSEKLRNLLKNTNLPIVVRENVPYAAIPLYLSIMDMVIMFIKPTFSKIASSPIKLGESLAMDKPVIINEGIGDVAHVEKDGMGFLVKNFTQEEYTRVVELLSKANFTNIRKKAHTFYHIDVGIERYLQLYTSLINQRKELLRQ